MAVAESPRGVDFGGGVFDGPVTVGAGLTSAVEPNCGRPIDNSSGIVNVALLSWIRGLSEPSPEWLHEGERLPPNQQVAERHF